MMGWDGIRRKKSGDGYFESLVNPSENMISDQNSINVRPQYPNENCFFQQVHLTEHSQNWLETTAANIILIVDDLEEATNKLCPIFFLQKRAKTVTWNNGMMGPSQWNLST